MWWATGLSFFKKPKDKIKGTTHSASVATPSAAAISVPLAANSPTKHVGLRAQCIHQLRKWHALLTTGAIDQGQYEELKETILGDIKQTKLTLPWIEVLFYILMMNNWCIHKICTFWLRVSRICNPRIALTICDGFKCSVENGCNGGSDCRTSSCFLR